MKHGGSIRGRQARDIINPPTLISSFRLPDELTSSSYAFCLTLSATLLSPLLHLHLSSSPVFLCCVSSLICFLLFFLQARPSGNSVFRGDKPTYVASEGSLGKYGCLGSGLLLPRGVQTKAQLWLAEIAFVSAVFGKMQYACAIEVVKKKRWVRTSYSPHIRDHAVNLQTLALSYAADTSLQRCVANGPWHYL